ncbi:MAG: hypothetical protein HC904_04300 [Blastochloris sp.]|nr:hypothetical protein [Blastochloris sp.]
MDVDYPQMRQQERVMGRALQFALGSLNLLGAQPLHPLPGTKEEPLPERFASEANLKHWLDALEWDRPWKALDAVSSQKGVLKLLPEATRQPLVDYIYNYVKAKQDKQTGMVGSGEAIILISGMAKFGWFCKEFDLPIPRADEDYAFVMRWYRTKPEVKTLTLVRNPIHHLTDLRPFLSQPMSEADKELVVRESTRMMKVFRQKDGAFSMQQAEFPLRPNDLYPPIGTSSRPQSDVNGTSQARTIREKAYELMGVPLEKIPPLAGSITFWEGIRRREGISNFPA